MPRRRRHCLEFETLEGKVLLSTGAVDRAAAVHVAAKPVKSFVLNTKPYVYVFLTSRRLPRNPSSGGYQIQLSFAGRKQLVASMGKVDMIEQLVPKLLTANELPDLGGATMTFSNAKGAVVLNLATSNTTTYRFSIVSATGKFAGTVGGTGSITIRLNHPKPPFTPQLILIVRSDRA
jgi:hypothetical protein